MKKRIVLFLLAALTLVCAGKENLLSDPSFEGRSLSWREYEFHGAETIIRLDRIFKNVPAGRQALVVRRISGGSLGAAAQTHVAVRENTAYTLQAFFMTGKGSEAFLQVDFINDAGSVLGSVKTPDKSSAKWGKAKLDFKTPSGTKTVNVILSLRGRTFAAFDLVKLQRDQKASNPDWNGFAARCLPVETVLAWSGKRVFHTFEDSPCALTFQFKGKYNTLVKPALVLDLPVELKIAQAFQQHPSWGDALTPEVTSITRDGKKYKRYRFKNPPFFKSLLNSWGWRRMMTVGLLPVSSGMAGREFKAFWFLENKNTASRVETFTIRLLKALPVKPMPRNFYVGTWIGFENDYPSRDVFMKAIRKLERSNLIGTVLLSASKGNNEVLRQRKFRMAAGSFHGDQAYQFRYMSKALQKKVAGRFYCKFYDGKINKSRMCPQFFLTDPDYEKFANESMKKAAVRVTGREYVFLDTEPWRPHNWCYCDVCIKAFMDFAKIKTVPSIRMLRSKYYDKWRSFRVEQSRLVIRKLSGMVRKYNPTARILDYDYPIDYTSQKAIRTFLSRCSKDPRSNEPYIDGHLSSFYHTLDQQMFDLVKIGRNTLKKDYYPILAIDPPGYLAKSSVLSPQRFRIMSVAASALGCKGIWIYSTSVLDGATIQGIHDAMVKIAVVERFYQNVFLKKDLLKVTCASKVLRYTFHKAGKERLLSLFNFDQKKGTIVTLRGLNGTVKDALTGKTLDVKGGVLTLKLAPGEERFILF